MGYASDHHHHHQAHYHAPHGQYAPAHEPRAYAQPYPIIDGDEWRRPSISIPTNAFSQSSSLANALGDVRLKLDSPTSPRTQTSPSQYTLPTPTPTLPVPGDNTPPDTPITDDGELSLMQNLTFIHETGSPGSTTPSTSSRTRASDSPSEVEPPPRKKRRRGPNKGPRKDPGFLACFFCRNRKIGCNPPQAENEDRRCE